MTGLRVATVDAFIGPDARGNPAGVAFLPAFPPDHVLQRVAREMGHSETAFLAPEEGDWRLRWFTSTREVDLCGHATLASAHRLWEVDRAPRGVPIRFRTLSGLLTARPAPGGIVLDFPAISSEPIVTPSGLAEALGAEVVWTRRVQEDFVVGLMDEARVRALHPDLAALRRLDPDRGAIVTAPGTQDADYVCRYFAPHFGIPEDPATGYAQCVLAPLWSQRLGQTDLRAHQVSDRGGRFRLRLNGDRVDLEGAAKTRDQRLVALA